MSHFIENWDGEGEGRRERERGVRDWGGGAFWARNT